MLAGSTYKVYKVSIPDIPNVLTDKLHILIYSIFVYYILSLSDYILVILLSDKTY